MDFEEKILGGLLRGLGVIFLTLIIGAYVTERCTDDLIADAIKRGSDPIAAACAFRESLDEKPVCFQVRQ